jgi:hypothetical protein
VETGWSSPVTLPIGGFEGARRLFDKADRVCLPPQRHTICKVRKAAIIFEIKVVDTRLKCLSRVFAGDEHTALVRFTSLAASAYLGQ